MNNGTRCSFTHTYPLSPVLHKPSALLIEDIDYDGDIDFITGHEGHDNQYYLGPPTPPQDTYDQQKVDAVKYRTVSMDLADINGDGCLELLVGNRHPPGPGENDGVNLYYYIGSSSPGVCPVPRAYRISIQFVAEAV